MPETIPSLTLRLLGPLDLGGARLPTRKAEVLVAYLALGAGRAHRRDSLLGLLWEDRAEKQARHSLSQTLFSIRKALGEEAGACLAIDGDTVTFLPEHAAVDALDFERLAALEDRATLSQAAGLYRGELLQGINLREAAVQDWLAAERTRYKELALSVLARSAALRERDGDLDGAVHDAVRLVALDPLQESGHRTLMRLYAAQGRPAAALRQFERCAAILKRELDEEPEPETRQLHAEIGRRRRSAQAVVPKPAETPSPVVRPPAPPPPRCATPLGREGELEKLELWLADVMASRRRVVFVTGSAGIGKTTLVDAFLGRAAERARVMIGRGQCIDHRGASEPFMPVLDALGGLCRTESQMRAALAAHAPSWLAQLPGLAAQEPPGGFGTRERMLRELLDALEAAAGQAPLLLVIEDLHWSDASTLDLIDGIARRRAPVPLMVLATCRDPEAAATPRGVFDLTRTLAYRSLASMLPLAPLGTDAVERCLAERFPGAAPPDGLAAALARRGGGNPLFMFNLLDWWIDRGLLVREDRALTLPDPAALETGVPESLGFLVGQQLEALDPGQRAALEAAAVAGDTVAAACVAAALDVTDETAEAVLGGLARDSSFVTAAAPASWPDGTETARFAFIHQLYRECIYERLAPASRRRLHGAIGERLERAFADGEAPAAELAMHFVAARDSRRALRYLELAAAQALRRSAHREAVDLLDRAMALLPSLEPRDRTAREARLQGMRGPALVATRGFSDPEPEAAFRRACELSREIDDREGVSSALFGLAALMEFRGDYRTTQALLTERRALLEDRCDSAVAVSACELMACSTFHNARFAESIMEADQAIAGYVAQRDMQLVAFLGENPLVSCHCWAGRALWFLGRPDDAVARLEQALRAAEDADHSFARALAHEHMARLREHRDEPTLARDHAEQAIVLGEAYGFPYRVASGLVMRGWARAVLGDPAEGVADIERGLAGCRALGAVLEYPYYLALLAKAHVAAGRPSAAMAVLEEALAQARVRDGFFYEAEILRLIAQLRLPDDEAGGEQALRSALSVARANGGIASETRAAVDLARLWLRRDRPAEAEQVLRGLNPPLNERPPSPAVAAAAELLAGLAKPMPVQQVRFCSAVDGACIAYSETGAGLPLVKAGNWLTHLEHDWNSPIWRPLFEELASTNRLVRYDPRGTGLSDWDPPEISFDRWVDDLAAVVDAAGLERFALLGISQGAAVSIAYAVRHPERVSHLVLFGGYSRGRLRRGEPGAAAFEEALNTLIREGWGQDHAGFRQMFCALYLPEGNAEQIGWFTELQRVSATPATAVRVRQACGSCDVSPLLPQVRAPTLVLHARRDAVVPFAEGRLMAARIPGARFVQLDGCNHLMLPDESEWPRMLAEIRRFLAQPEAPRPPAPGQVERRRWPRPRPSSPGSGPGAAP